MKDHIKAYRKSLESLIGQYMACPASERYAATVANMLECWEEIKKAECKMKYSEDFTAEDAKEWADSMENVDGTMGAHWTVAQTASVANNIGVKFEHMSETCWNVAMNMMYSDYQKVASKYGVDKPEFYADMAKAFLFDPDGGTPKEKLSEYYKGVVKKDY